MAFTDYTVDKGYGIKKPKKSPGTQLTEQDWQNWVELINDNFKKATGVDVADSTDAMRKTLYNIALQQFKAGFTPEQMKNDNAVSVETLSKSNEGRAYKKDFDTFTTDLQSTVKYYDKDYWTEDRLKEEFNKQYANHGHDGIDQVVENIGTVLYNDFTDKVDQGIYDNKGNKNEGFTLDPTTGKYTYSGGTDPWKSQFDKVTQNLGLVDKYALSDSAKQYYAEKLQKGEIKEYELEQALKGDAQYIKKEYDTAYEQYKPYLDTAFQQDLDNITRMGETALKETTRTFEEIAPTVQKYYGSLGGTDRASAASALAKEGGELAKARETYMSDLKAQAYSADAARKLALEQGRFEDIRQIAGYEQGQANSLLANVMENNYQAANKLEKLQANSMAALTASAQARYDREVAREQKRLDTLRMEATKAANKKAARYGLFSNVLSGTVQGAISGASTGNLYGGIAGGVTGGIGGYAKGTAEKNNQKMEMDYNALGKGTGSLFANYNARKATESQFGY